MVSRRSPADWTRSKPANLTLFTGVPMGVGLALSTLLPVELTLPVLSVVLIISAGSLALVAWCGAERADDRRLTYRDISGLLVFLGIAAGLLADPEDVLPLLQKQAADQ